MAATITVQGTNNFGNKFARFCILQADDSYPAGGYAVAAADCDLGSLGGVGIMDVVSQGGYIWGVNHLTNYVMAYQQSGAAGPLAEVAAGTDLSAEAIGLMCIQGS